jgi:hypothetical protein
MRPAISPTGSLDEIRSDQYLDTPISSATLALDYNGVRVQSTGQLWTALQRRYYTAQTTPNDANQS